MRAANSRMLPQGREDHVLLVILEAADDVAGGGAHLAGHPRLLPAQCCYAILAVFVVALGHTPKKHPSQNHSTLKLINISSPTPHIKENAAAQFSKFLSCRTRYDKIIF